MEKYSKLIISNKAFTLFEVLLILALIGVLSSIAITLYPKSHLELAKEQIIRHLKYTRFLALNNAKEITQNEFCQSDNCESERKEWQKSMWRLQFSELKNIGWSYSIFSDGARKSKDKDFDSRPMDSIEVARDLLDGSFLSVYTYNNSKFANRMRQGDLALTSRYGVENVIVEGCSRNKIGFDENGFLLCDKEMKIILQDGFKKESAICINKNGKIQDCENRF